MTKRPFSDKGRRATELLELVHSDVCGPLNQQARGGYEYFVTFTTQDMGLSICLNTNPRPLTYLRSLGL